MKKENSRFLHLEIFPPPVHTYGSKEEAGDSRSLKRFTRLNYVEGDRQYDPSDDRITRFFRATFLNFAAFFGWIGYAVGSQLSADL